MRGYLVGIVNGAKILFLHCETFDRAMERWLDRVSRIGKENIVILMTDRDGFKDAHKENDSLHYLFARKILFSHLPAKEADPIIYVPGFEDAGFVGELYGNYEYFDNSHVKRSLAKML